MGKACEVVENIINNKKNYDNAGLKKTKNRKWREFNFLVGENGAGKSRFLKLIKDEAQRKCNVIHMDFSSLNLTFQTKISDEVNNELASAIVFNKKLNNNILDNFAENACNQVLVLFELLSELMNGSLTKQQAETIIDKINPSINMLLKREIKIDKNKICLKKDEYIKDIDLEWNLMSPGEKSILVIIITVLYIAILNKPSIILIDEIETHLHPAVQTEVLKLLRNSLDGHDHCTCIASHSIFLLPEFSIKDVVYINNGEIQRVNGVLYQQIYNKLIGVDNKESLAEFLNSVASWQYAEYLAECFLAPITVDEASMEDEQACKLKEVLSSKYKDMDNINILDFGAGDARIAMCIELMLQDKADVQLAEICKKIKYHIYDKYKITDKFNENQEWRGRAYSSEAEINNDKGKFDIVILFNVLHEVGIDEWVSELNFIFQLLKEDGIILFGERKTLSVGEKPYGKSGYLVLGQEELETLFPTCTKENIPLPNAIKEVTICYAIKKKTNKDTFVSRRNVKETIQLLEENSRKKIRDIQRAEPVKGESVRAREYAFYCQQYINAQEAIDILSQEDSLSKNYIDVKLQDILQSNLSFSQKKRLIAEVAKETTAEGRKCRRYLKNLEEEN